MQCNSNRRWQELLLWFGFMWSDRDEGGVGGLEGAGIGFKVRLIWRKCQVCGSGMVLHWDNQSLASSRSVW